SDLVGSDCFIETPQAQIGRAQVFVGAKRPPLGDGLLKVPDGIVVVPHRNVEAAKPTVEFAIVGRLANSLLELALRICVARMVKVELFELSVVTPIGSDADGL